MITLPAREWAVTPVLTTVIGSLLWNGKSVSVDEQTLLISDSSHTDTVEPGCLKNAGDQGAIQIAVVNQQLYSFCTGTDLFSRYESTDSSWHDSLWVLPRAEPEYLNDMDDFWIWGKDCLLYTSEGIGQSWTLDITATRPYFVGKKNWIPIGDGWFIESNYFDGSQDWMWSEAANFRRHKYFQLALTLTPAESWSCLDLFPEGIANDTLVVSCASRISPSDNYTYRHAGVALSQIRSELNQR